ncbi:sporulation kinase E [bacterium BMS3Abin10]|nr:sporulation kinase E [bacterium BMS3Abin10]GBE39602.1 sporulation kinase E [bacterium BMS3Bbin08]HDH50584.1 PAS domain S-box protein [Nitrospirota bacterium]
MKIANKISFSFLITALVLTFVGTSSFYISAKSALKDSISAHLQTTAQSRAHHIETFLEEHKGHMQMLSELELTQDLFSPGQQMESLNGLLKKLHEHAKTKYINTLFAISPEGTIIASSSKGDTGKDGSVHVDIARTGEDIHVTDVRIAGNNKGVIDISALIRARKTGRFSGFLSAEIDLGKLDEITTDRTGLGKTGEIYLVNKDGFMITPSRFQKNTFLKQKVDSWNFKTARINRGKNLTDEIKAAIFPDYRGVKVLGTYQYIPQMDWVLLAEIEESEAFAPMKRLKAIFVILMLFIPLTAWLTGAFVAKKITRPVHELHKGTEIIGMGNLEYKVGTQAKDEIGQLSRAFNEMTRKLQEKTTSIDNLNREVTERIAKEEEITRQKQFIEKVINGLNDPFYVINRDHTVVLANEAAIKRGITKGTRCYKVTHGEEKPCEGKHACPMREVLRTRRPVTLEHVHYDNKGGPRIMEVHGDPIFDKNGDVVQMIEYSIDITERKQMEEKLKESEEKYRTQFNEALDGMVIADASTGVILDCNPAAAKLVGRERAELIGQHQKILHPPEENNGQYSLTFKEHLKGKEGESLDAKVITKDGKLKDVSIKANLLEIGGRKFLHGIFRDITERKKAEQKIKRSETSLAEAQQIAHIGNWDWDIVHNELRWSDEIYRIFGLVPRQVRATYEAFLNSIHPDDRENVRQAVNNALYKKATYSIEHHVVQQDGTERVVQEQGKVIFDGNGKPVRMMGTVQDITERKRTDRELHDAYKKIKEAQEQLIQAGKMAAMGQLAAGISHELNQPLTGVKGFAQTVLMDLEENSPFKRDMEKIVEQADRMDNIIRHIRFFARKSEFRMKELNVNEPIEDSLTLLSEQLKIHNIRVKKSLTEGLPMILGDPNQLEQVFLNFVTNARDAIDGLKNPDGGEIIIKTFPSDDRQNVEIVFGDTGGGVPEKDQEHIFNPFFTTKSPNGGMGLGLSIVYRIIEDHKGTITVDNQPGKGVTFKITLPVYKEVAPLDSAPAVLC